MLRGHRFARKIKIKTMMRMFIIIMKKYDYLLKMFNCLSIIHILSFEPIFAQNRLHFIKIANRD